MADRSRIGSFHTRLLPLSAFAIVFITIAPFLAHGLDRMLVEGIAPAPSPDEWDWDGPSPSPSPEAEAYPTYDSPPPPSPPTNDEDPSSVKWCAVRSEEFLHCQDTITLLQADNNDTTNWSCIEKESASECMAAIKAGEADLINLDAGLAYVAFANFSMKAIMAEEYCYHSTYYEAVAVVNREICETNPNLGLGDFRGLKSCHPGYLTAAGWNYPVRFLLTGNVLNPEELSAHHNDSSLSLISHFFSQTCAPSVDLVGGGLCTSCGDNGTCPSESPYGGYAGAFRCLMDGTGDIAFLRSDTAQRLSLDGANKQDWSTKPVQQFMYLCPGGGCREINDNIGNCTFGTVPANVIMARNSLEHEKRVDIVNTLLNADWTETLFSGKNPKDHVLSNSAQGLTEVTKLTRQYLGDSSAASQMVEELTSKSFQSTNVSSLTSGGAPSSPRYSMFLILLGLIFCIQGFFQ